MIEPQASAHRGRGPRPSTIAGLLGWAALLAAVGPGRIRGESIPVGRGTSLADALARAKPGDVVALPAGTFPGGVRLPVGVGLRGAGHRETILDAKGADVGLTVGEGSGAEVADLSIRGGVTGLLVKGASRVAVRRVRVTDAVNGIRIVDVDGGRVENVLSAGNRYGVLVVGGSEVVVVNGTIAGNSGLGLSLASGRRHAAFNNCIADGATGVYVGSAVEGLRLDHNLYHTLFTAKMEDQAGRKSLGDWTYMSGLDAHSVQLPVTFSDPKSGDYRPVGALRWSLDRAATSDWGAARLGDVEAPDRDIDGRARVGRTDVGAYEVAPTPPRPADGTLKVRSDAGLKSAGLFDGEGREVEYLFHNMPLAAGDYPFWFPARDFLGRPIPAGAYEVRSVEADHRWEYLGTIGDTGESHPAGRTAPVALSWVALDDGGRLLAGQGWSEDGTNIRAYEASTGKPLWTLAGSSPMNGLAPGSDGALYMTRPAEKSLELVRVATASGKVAPLGGKGAGRTSLPTPIGPDATGLAELDGRIYVADARANKVRFGPADGSRWDGAIDVASPSCPVADRKTRVVWVISEGRRVLALGPDGAVLSERDFSGLAPAALAAGGGRLAIATRAEGLVRVLDVPDPRAKAKSGWTIGRGDGPFGPYLPDRFTFQGAPRAPEVHVALAIGANGDVAVVDGNRLLVFDAKGARRWGAFGVFGNATAPSFADPARVYDTDGRRSLLMDADSWRPGGYYDLPVEGEFLGDFPLDGRTYGVVLAGPPGRPSPDLVIVRYDGYRARPVFAMIFDPARKVYFTREDANRDGSLDARDGGEVVMGSDGKPFAGPALARFNILQPDGTLFICGMEADRWATLWHPTRDPDGTPSYRPGGRERLPRPAGPFLSPYTREPDPTNGFYSAAPDPDGGAVADLNLRSSPDGTGVMHNAGTDLAGFDRRGRLRWFHTCDEDRGLEGLSAVWPVAIAGVASTAEILAVDRDGLGLGSFSEPAGVHYPGFFLDHPQAVRAYRGPDGRTYALIADNFNGRHHRYRLDGADRIKPTSTPVALAAKAAESLAAAPSPPPYAPTRPATPLVRIPRLDRPMPIDGGLAKWRAAGVAPQIVITPETSGGGIDGPRDCSAVVRLAYHGADLYAQFLIFDDVVSFHQGVAKHHMQDGVELCLNGFATGFKFDVTRTADAGPLVLRNRFYFTKLTRALPEALAPRSVTVLDDARDVAERELIEGVYGVDMSGCRVIVAEFRLPIDAETYRDSPDELKAIAPWGPGREFWLGFLINDNDEPGTDVQNYLAWPATYNNFVAKEEGARAVLE